MNIQKMPLFPVDGGMDAKRLIAACLAAVAFAVEGVETKRIIDGATNWCDPESYSDKGRPSPGDVVIIPAGATVTVDSDDQDSVALVSSLGQIYPEGTQLDSTGRVIFNIRDGAVVTNKSPLYGSGYRGRFVKTGKGTLVLDNAGKQMKDNTIEDHGFYMRDSAVAEGVLVLPQNASSSHFRCGTLAVSNGATLYLPTRAATVASGTFKLTADSLTGGGLVTNSAPESLPMDFKNEVLAGNIDFSGDVGGAASLSFRLQQTLSGVDSTFPGGVTSYGSSAAPGVVHVRKFGKKGQPSSVGTGNILIGSYGGGFCYIGDGEETDKELVAYPGLAATIDAGAKGGVTFTGKWRYSGSEQNMMGHIILKGSNTSYCVLANTVDEWIKNGTNYTFFITKRGTGTWRFSDSLAEWSGALAVEEGTVQFESILDRGALCSLGYANVLTEPYTSVWDEDKVVGWAYRLGSGTGGMGVMEYAGDRLCQCTTRPIALAGDGELNVSNPEGSLRFAGVHGHGTGERLLILRSFGANTNHLADVNGSNTCISIEKQGSGVWRLTGNFKPKGDIAVKEGTLVLDGDDVPRRYSWFRFSAKELLDPSQTAVTMQDIALYDEHGRRCNEGLVFETPDPYPTNKYGYCECDMAALMPGCVQYGIPGYYKFDVQSTDFAEGKESDLRRLFDGISSGSQSPMSVVRRRTQNQGSEVAPSAGDPSSWFSFVMRLPEGSPEIVAYDISRGSGSDVEKKRHPVKFRLEGSEEGFRWDVLHDTEAEGAARDVSTGGYQWYSDGSAFEKSMVLRPGKGFRFVIPDSPDADGLSDVRTVSVASGAKFVSRGRSVIRRLAVDANGAGTLDGFEFAEGAELSLDVLNAPSATFDLPGEYVNIMGLDNVSKCSLSFDGVAQSAGKWVVSARNGKIVVGKRSLRIIVR